MPNYRTSLQSIEDLHPLVLTVLEKSDGFDDVSLFDVRYDGFHDPFLFDYMEEAVARITQAVTDKERVIIFSDFDTDGIPAAAMWHDFFETVGHENYEIYIPQRDIEGFGLKVGQVEKFAEDDTDLLITTDCGIRSHEAVAAAKEAGMDVIITDHHVAADELPVADIIINPALENESYPFSKLCGAGVVFKILQALEARSELDLPPNFSKGQIGMAAIATVSDMVPLVGENRLLATFGLKLLRQTNRPGLRALYEKGRIRGRELTEVDIGFTIGSHINAASRLDEPMAAFDLLVTRNIPEGKRLAKALHALYRKRKRKTKAVKKQVFAATADMTDASVVAYGSSDWKPALLGPVAHRITDQRGQPTFLWGEAAGRKKGSARAANHNVVKMLDAVSNDHLSGFGGHEMAGGFELASPAGFPDALSNVVDQFQIGDTGFDSVVVSCSLSDLSWRLYRSLEILGPFGVGNPQPLFHVSEVAVSETRSFGADGSHVSITITDGDQELETVAFFATQNMQNVSSGDVISVTGGLEKTTFGFKKKLQFKIKSVE